MSIQKWTVRFEGMDEINGAVTVKCVSCRSDFELVIASGGKLVNLSCPCCQFHYPVIEGVVLTLRDQDDFFRYNSKLNRFIKAAE